MPVLVEIRRRKTWGVALRLKAESDFPELKEIQDIKAGHWADGSRTLVRLYEWIAAYYQCELGVVFKPLVKRGIVNARAKTVTEYHYSGTVPSGLTEKQTAAACRARTLRTGATHKSLRSRFGVSSHMISALVKHGVLVKTTREVLREAVEMCQATSHWRFQPTREQDDAVAGIWEDGGKPTRPFLLHGITGSGKTIVYVELARKTLSAGKGVIILVPEISLTPQTIQRFRGALGNGIAVIHSRMSDGERRDSIEQIISGKKRVVIGARSAILVPMADLGLIVVDEEHDGSYKQGEAEPRYHARDVAVVRGQYQNARVVLGSATPSMESFHNAGVGKYYLVKLASRFGEGELPSVRIVDMTGERRENNWSLLSRHLHARITETLAGRKQIILLLNRRGFSVSLLCRECGYVQECPNCSVNLVYHRTEQSLRCHQCGYAQEVSSSCPRCSGEQIKYRGIGIQKAEEYLRQEFPKARIVRMDQDTTRRKGSHVSILETFGNMEADVLLGTQMVAKGLDFPGVRLVGVLQADIGLHFPDFRASERTFQLLAQVAGRAGRQDALGEVVIQTFSPEEPGILAAARQDCEEFYEQELDARKTLAYPPFSRLTRLIVQGDGVANVRSRAREVADFLRGKSSRRVIVLGPSPAALSRLKNEYRYSILLKSTSPPEARTILHSLRRKWRERPGRLKLVIDVDPLNML